MIEMLRKYSPDGIELSFAFPEYLANFNITEENLKYLRSLKYVTIHAPWKNIQYGNNETSKKVLEKIEQLYEKINAKNVTFHPIEIEDVNIFDKYSFNVSIENEDWKKSSYNSIEKMKQILDSNKRFKMTLDFAHVLTVDSNDIKSYIDEFADRISQIHLAYHNRNLNDHYFLYKHQDEVKEFVGHIKNLNVPIVLEAVAPNEEEVPLIKNEIEYVKKILNIIHDN